MRVIQIITVLLITVAASSAYAQADGVTDSSQIGKVDMVFVQEARGLYYEKKLLRRPVQKSLWVEVRFATALPGEVKSELFRVPVDIAIERGDLVSTRFGDESPRNLNLLPLENQVTKLVAKYDTLMAMTFGDTNSRRGLGQFAQAQTCSVLTPIQVAYVGASLK